jgi:hypothetical protein
MSAAYQAIGDAQALLSGDGEKFKQFVTQTGTELAADGLRYFGFLSKGRMEGRGRLGP